jgi:hypothetical protein
MLSMSRAVPTFTARAINAGLLTTGRSSRVCGSQMAIYSLRFWALMLQRTGEWCRHRSHATNCIECWHRAYAVIEIHISGAMAWQWYADNVPISKSLDICRIIAKVFFTEPRAA